MTIAFDRDHMAVQRQQLYIWTFMIFLGFLIYFLVVVVILGFMWQIYSFDLDFDSVWCDFEVVVKDLGSGGDVLRNVRGLVFNQKQKRTRREYQNINLYFCQFFSATKRTFLKIAIVFWVQSFSSFNSGSVLRFCLTQTDTLNSGSKILAYQP